MSEAESKISPNMSLNSSFGLSASIANSPNVMNLSDKFKFLMPDMTAKNRKQWSPFEDQVAKSPSLSPIQKENSPSPFLKRRSRNDNERKSPRSMYQVRATKERANSNLDLTLSVKTVLKDMRLLQLFPIFEREEIDLMVFFTLTDDELMEIGVDNETDRRKILDFINDFNTPKKLNKIPRKNVLYRH